MTICCTGWHCNDFHSILGGPLVFPFHLAQSFRLEQLSCWNSNKYLLIGNTPKTELLAKLYVVELCFLKAETSDSSLETFTHNPTLFWSKRAEKMIPVEQCKLVWCTIHQESITPIAMNGTCVQKLCFSADPFHSCGAFTLRAQS